MNITIKINPSHEKAVLKMLDSMLDMGVIEQFESESNKKVNFGKDWLSETNEDSSFLSTKEFIDQYRDLVD